MNKKNVANLDELEADAPPVFYTEISLNREKLELRA